MNIKQEYIDRFWEKVDKSGDCWEWTAGKDKDGYGMSWIEKSIKAHRVSYLINIGPIPLNMCVCHACDNTSCVNPEHLWLGTNADNVQDRENKGRSCFQHGEKGHNARLKNCDANEIREKYKTGKFTQEEISKQYVISRRAIGNIINNRTYSEQ